MKHLKITYNGAVYEVDVEETCAVAAAPSVRVAVPAAAPAAAAPAGADAFFVEAPISGRIVKLFVAVGDRVTEDQPIAILEAMKLENEITAGQDGVIRELRVKEDQIVNTEDVIAVIG